MAGQAGFLSGAPQLDGSYSHAAAGFGTSSGRSPVVALAVGHVTRTRDEMGTKEADVVPAIVVLRDSGELDMLQSIGVEAMAAYRVPHSADKPHSKPQTDVNIGVEAPVHGARVSLGEPGAIVAIGYMSSTNLAHIVAVCVSGRVFRLRAIDSSLHSAVGQPRKDATEKKKSAATSIRKNVRWKVSRVVPLCRRALSGVRSWCRCVMVCTTVIMWHVSFRFCAFPPCV